MLRVVLADDQPWLRSAVRLLIEQEADIKIVGEAADAAALIRAAAALEPDLILLDWELPGLKRSHAGRMLVEGLRQANRRLQIIALSERPESNRTATAAGATAFVSKAAPPEQLLAALHNAQQSAKMHNAENSGF